MISERAPLISLFRRRARLPASACSVMADRSVISAAKA
jgi:hypothetical protein